MARNSAQGRVAAAAVKARADKRRSRLMTGGLAVAAIAVVAVAIVIGVASGGGAGSDQRAPDFAFSLYQGGSDLGGRHLNLHQLDGKPVVLNFWAGLCPPCRAEMPDLQAFYDANKEDVTLVGVDIGQFMSLGSKQDAQNLLQELNITYPAGFTDDGGVVRDYRVLGMPTTVFIRSDGTIFNRWTGALTRKDLEAQVQLMQAGQ